MLEHRVNVGNELENKLAVCRRRKSEIRRTVLAGKKHDFHIAKERAILINLNVLDDGPPLMQPGYGNLLVAANFWIEASKPPPTSRRPGMDHISTVRGDTLSSFNGHYNIISKIFGLEIRSLWGVITDNPRLCVWLHAGVAATKA
jgi:hypothetical protein